MANALAVAKFLNELNKSKHGCDMNQMKMHKLMYFSQRESLMITDDPLFEDAFEAWKYGPVLTVVRNEYSTGHMFNEEYGSLKGNDRELVTSVFNRYDVLNAWDLGTISHEEFSWKQARAGLAPNENGRKSLSLSAMRVDAKRELLRRRGVVLA